MNLAMAYCAADRDAAQRWMEHCSRFNQRRHDLYLMPARGIELVLGMWGEGWRTVTNLSDWMNIRSNWHTNAATRDASGPNSMFRQFARYFGDRGEPWMFCEPDAIPLCDGWLDRIEDEYRSAGKPYMAALIEKPWKHVSGNMVCPPEAAMESTLILPVRDKKGVELAFDLAGARAVLPKCHITNLIQHQFRAPEFTSRDDFEARVSKEAVLFHSCKGGSIFQYLRNGGDDPSKRLSNNSTSSKPKLSDVLESSAALTVQPSSAAKRPKESREHMLLRLAKARAARKQYAKA